MTCNPIISSSGDLDWHNTTYISIIDAVAVFSTIYIPIVQPKNTLQYHSSTQHSYTCLKICLGKGVKRARILSYSVNFILASLYECTSCSLPKMFGRYRMHHSSASRPYLSQTHRGISIIGSIILTTFRKRTRLVTDSLLRHCSTQSTASSFFEFVFAFWHLWGVNVSTDASSPNRFLSHCALMMFDLNSSDWNSFC